MAPTEVAPAATEEAMEPPADLTPTAEITIVSDGLLGELDPTRLKANSDKRFHVFTFDALRNLGPDGHYPSLATGFEVGPDGTTVDWTLREGVNFHNGDPFTARDVEFTYKTVGHGFQDEGSIHTYASAHRRILDFESTGDHHIRFNLEKPFPDLFSSMRTGTLEIVPKAYYESAGIEGFQKHPIGTGPFKFVEFKKDDRLVYEANENYWGEGPFVKSITVLEIPEPTTRFLMLKQGQADIVLGLAGDQLQQVIDDPDLDLSRSKQAWLGAALMFPRPNSPVIKGRAEGETSFKDDKAIDPASPERQEQVKVYENPQVRLAFGMAIDRQAIVESLAPACTVATSYIPPAAFGYNSAPEASITYEYDPEGAKKILSDAGIPLDGTFEDTWTASPRSSSGLPAVQVWDAMVQYWNAIGLSVKRRNLEQAAYVQENRSNTIPGIYNFGGSNPVDGGRLTWVRFSRGSTWNDTILRDDYDAQFEAIRSEGDPQKRAKLIGDWMVMEATNMESIPMWWCDQTFGFSKKTIGSMTPTPGLGDDYNPELIRPVQ
jgi:peptide/nickel transport system substrate-binding protein